MLQSLALTGAVFAAFALTAALVVVVVDRAYVARYTGHLPMQLHVRARRRAAFATLHDLAEWGRERDRGETPAWLVGAVAALLVGVATVPIIVGVVVGGLDGDADRGRALGAALGSSITSSMFAGFAAVFIVVTLGRLVRPFLVGWVASRRPGAGRPVDVDAVES